ncbi:MAG: radical SAM protein [Colwellia sp.]|uniref:radical SAM protein n=1 Tax=Pseudoalteromonas sp. SCSIO 43088 TaxID=2822846 RepID=UPI00202AE0FB|nr:radical SAM protein [Pseudoalteromonas sp. SCSIO 43088]URQ87762.1 radical SAM protein [Pseudoalteromonas sp. SCSIO 43088]
MIDRACISLGERCNLKCAYCHFHNEDNGKLSGLPQEFNTDELKSIIDAIHRYAKISGIDTFKIGIVGSGEPLLQYRKIKYLIQYVLRQGIENLQFYTITNGTILNKDILDFFYKNQSLIKLCFSVDGYEELHNVGREKFDEVYKGVKKYEEKFKEKPPINCTVHQETLKNQVKLFEFLTDENFKDVTFSRLFDSHDQSLVVTEPEYKDLLEFFKGSQFEVRQLDENKKKKYDCTMYGSLCGVGRTNIFITKRGIYPCGRFYGNEDYNYGPFDMELSELEALMKKMKPLKDGECYFDKYVGLKADENSNIWHVEIR